LIFHNEFQLDLHNQRNIHLKIRKNQSQFLIFYSSNTVHLLKTVTYVSR